MLYGGLAQEEPMDEDEALLLVLDGDEEDKTISWADVHEADPMTEEQHTILTSWRNVKPVRGRDPGLGNLGGVLGEAPNISLYLSPRIPPRFPSPGSFPPTCFTFPLVKMRPAMLCLTYV